jgi:hypothetical protein
VAEHHPVELPPRDGGRAGGAGEQVPAAGVHQRGRDAGPAGELGGPALHQPRPGDQVHRTHPQPQPQRRGAGLLIHVCVACHEPMPHASSLDFPMNTHTCGVFVLAYCLL